MDLPIRDNVLAMQPYSPGKPITEVKRELGLNEVIKLASNENPLGPSPRAVAVIQQAAGELHRYPDAASYDLLQAIAKKFELDPTEVIVGNGSDELIHVLGQIFLGRPDDEVIVGQPSFVRYDAAAHLAGSKLIQVPNNKDMGLDLEAMAAKISPKTKLIFLANPNNPTGTYFNRAQFRGFLAHVPKTALVVLDEAYYEYARAEEDLPVSTDFFRQHPNVFGLRTFSKAYGLAGIRLGFGIGSPEVIDAMNRAREPFNVNLLAQLGGIAALEDEDHLSITLRHNREGMQRMLDQARELGIQAVPSAANFVYYRLGQPAEPIFQALLRAGIIVRVGPSMGADDAMRVSVGTPGEVDQFLRAFEQVITEGRSE
ncbi:MAG: histidinol-phosphate transaminase [Armatimonadetes bacterium]|nr:histidinol-phosphate transaminase [Armatimonadota bacterium]